MCAAAAHVACDRERAPAQTRQSVPRRPLPWLPPIQGAPGTDAYALLPPRSGPMAASGAQSEGVGCRKPQTCAPREPRTNSPREGAEEGAARSTCGRRGRGSR